MTSSEKREMAQRLRGQAEEIRQHGVTNFFEHTYACIHYGQVPKERAEDRCNNCPLRPFVPPQFRDEVFPCQHITPEGWEMAAGYIGLAEDVVASLLRSAAQLEAEAAAANS